MIAKEASIKDVVFMLRLCVSRLQSGVVSLSAEEKTE